ncbi:MAG TPA: SulP family inorganic anion transporter [Opitutaceae bacterium]|nr:SulP family inorganic anion transporter [Opitutaceae bacterium]
MNPADTFKEALSDASALSAKMFRLRLPFVAEMRHYSWDKLRSDLVAGATLTLVSIPQAIGFALILGLPPTSVILSVVIGGFISALFFSSHHHVFGPTTSVSLITATAIAANSGLGLDPLPLAAYMAFLIGAVQFLAGLLNFGEITKFISRSVVVAYTAAIGILLITSQLPNFLGFGVPAGQRFVTILTDVSGALARVNVSAWAIGIGVLTLAIFEGIKFYRKTWPEALIGLAALGLLARLLSFLIGRYHLFGLSAMPFRLVKDEGALTAAFPTFTGLPSMRMQLHMLPALASTAIAVAIIGMLEATAITKSLAAKSGQHLDPNQELMGMGAGNIAVGLFGATPGSSSFTRSAVNYQSGAASQLSSILSSVVVLLILFFVTPVFNYIPVAALAAHLMRVGYKLINRHQIRVAMSSTRSDLIVFVVTLGAALFLKLDNAIYVGIGVALALFLQKTSTPSLVEYTFNESGILSELTDPAKRPNPQISIIHVEGDLFFGAADLFQEHLRRQAEDENIRVFILRMKNARHLDASTVMAMETLHDYLRQTGRHLIISGCNADVLRVLQRSGLLAQMGAENVFPAEVNLTMSTKRALQRASQLLKQTGAGGQKADVRIFYDSRRQQQAAPAPTGAVTAPPPEPPEDYAI